MHDFHAYHRDPIYYRWCEACVAWQAKAVAIDQMLAEMGIPRV